MSGDEFTKYDLGHLKRGSTVVVTLTSGANVRLMDRSNLNNFTQGRRHKYHGGLVDRSPYRIPVPNDGTWYLTVDVTGLRSGAKSNSFSAALVKPFTLAAGASRSDGIALQHPARAAAGPHR